MQKPIKNLLERNSFVLAVIFSILILVLSLANLQGMPSLGTYQHSDKVKHTIAYSILSFFWVTSCYFGKIKIKSLYVILIILTYGIIIEVLQTSFTSYRTGDLLDILANSLGVFIGYIFFKLVDRIYLQV